MLLGAWAMAATPGWAQTPAVNFIIECRWVDRAVAPGAQAAVRDGAVVVGTGGSYSPRGPGPSTSTMALSPPAPWRLQVANGQRASQQQARTEASPALDIAVELGPDGRPQRTLASPRPADRRVVQSFTAQANWPGGAAPVRVTFSLSDDGQDLASTVDLPLDRWHTVARSGGGAGPATRGLMSSRDAAGTPERELQMRISLQP